MHCCADEVFFNSASNQYFVAEAGAQGPPPVPQLKPPPVEVIDAVSGRLVGTIVLGKEGLGFHQVAGLGAPGTVFVPEADGIHLFAARRSSPRFTG
jgi:hypothetical protein